MTKAARRVLVTGGTGTLGRVLTPMLAAAGHEVTVLSRRPSTGSATASRSVVADLVSGDGVEAAVGGAEVVVHLATANGRRDVDMMRTLVAAARGAGVGRTPLLLYLSIVGCDEIPLPYYRHKHEAERIALESGLPVTVLRSTQFHPLVDRLFSSQRRLPWLLVPDIPLQPVDLGEVAQRLVELVSQPAGGRVADLGGPEVKPLPEFATLWQQAHGRRGRRLPLRLPGPTFAAFRAGHQLVPGAAHDGRSFAEYLNLPPADSR